MSPFILTKRTLLARALSITVVLSLALGLFAYYKWQDSGPKKLSSQIDEIHLTLSRQDLKAVTEDFPSLQERIQVTPHLDSGGNILGFAIHAIDPEFTRLFQLQTGDVLLEVNGLSLRSAENALEIAKILQHSPEIRLRLSRGSQLVDQVYRIAP